MPKDEALSLYAILDSFDKTGDELENILDTFELARSELETAMPDLFDGLEYVMEQMDSCRKLYHRKKKKHRIYFDQASFERQPIMSSWHKKEVYIHGLPLQGYH